jgi:15-cis-phytoene synthase
MSAEACADLVARGDPERWRAAMLAPLGRQAGLMAIYAFNVEVTRAPWIGSEPLIAQIRLRWWADAIAEIYAGAPPRRHDVVAALGEAIRASDLPRQLFEELIEARMGDVEIAPHPDRAALNAYLGRTSGHLTELAARQLGAAGASLGPVRDFAQGAGLAAYFRAVPELVARGRQPIPGATIGPGVLPEGAAETIRALAAEGRAAVARARAARRLVPAEAAPAMLPGRHADLVLRRAQAEPARVLQRGLEPSELRSRAGLVWRAFSGRW